MPKAVSQMLTLLCRLVTPPPRRHAPGPAAPALAAGQRAAAGSAGCGDSRLGRLRPLAPSGAAGLGRREGHWQPQTHDGYQPVPVDVTAFWRPRLRGCPTSHSCAEAGKALPAIPVGLVARVGTVGGQRLGLPLAAHACGGRPPKRACPRVGARGGGS